MGCWEAGEGEEGGINREGSGGFNPFIRQLIDHENSHARHESQGRSGHMNFYEA